MSFGDGGMMGSEWTGRYGEEDPQLACSKGHWMLDLPVGCNTEIIDIEKAMEKARTCTDFEERPTR